MRAIGLEKRFEEGAINLNDYSASGRNHAAKAGVLQ